MHGSTMRSRTATAALATALLVGLVAAPAPARARKPTAPGLFPSVRQTVADRAQITGRRVHLRRSRCTVLRSDCHDVALLNELDGFDLDPRIEIAFHRRIDVGRVNARTAFLRGPGRTKIALNRLVWSPARNTLYAHPVSQLAPATTYALVVSRTLSGRGAHTTFQTMSAPNGLVGMRRELDSGRAYDDAGIPGDHRGLRFVRPDGRRTVFPASNVVAINRVDDTGRALARNLVPNTALRNAGSFAFGSFQSPSFLTADRIIPAVPTRTGVPRARGREEVGFALILPAGTKPAGGWPVAVFGPGITRSKYDVFLAADENAARGIATIAIDPVGHAFGPRSSVEVQTLVPPTTTSFSGFGRGRDLDGNGTITDQEGVSAPVQPNPFASVALRDGLRQTALDNMALVRAVRRGADVDGDGSSDLSATRTTYYAQSLGGIYGTMLMGVDPLVRTGVLNVPGGPILDIARLSPGFRPQVAAELRNRVPSLLNGGREGFTESTPLFVDPPVLAPARGAVDIQRVGAWTDWLDRPGSPETYAPLLRAHPLADVGAKRVLYQIAFGDQTVPNPTSATLIRAGGLRDVTTYYRNDRSPTAASNPHGFLLDPRLAGRNLGQRQVVEFLASDGATLVDPDGAAGLFETPIADPAALERLNYALPPATGEPPPEAAAPVRPRTRARARR